jgi:hypothetical protein
MSIDDQQDHGPQNQPQEPAEPVLPRQGELLVNSWLHGGDDGLDDDRDTDLDVEVSEEPDELLEEELEEDLDEDD